MTIKIFHNPNHNPFCNKNFVEKKNKKRNHLLIIIDTFIRVKFFKIDLKKNICNFIAMSIISVACKYTKLTTSKLLTIVRMLDMDN